LESTANFRKRIDEALEKKRQAVEEEPEELSGLESVLSLLSGLLSATADGVAGEELD
jgi:hypothetical protein